MPISPFIMETKSAMPGHSSGSGKRVHYADDSEQDDKLPEGENCSVISEISKSSMKYTGDANSELSIGASILDVEEQDPKMSKKRLEALEYKIKYLENENKEVNANLVSERVRASKLEKKLQFVKDNQEVFMRLKEAYINMKYNEAAGRKMIEIREKAVQTWEGIICSSCTESEELRRQIDVMIKKYKELFVVSPGEMEHLMTTVKYLKDLIDRREKCWAGNVEREQKLQYHLTVLKSENVGLKELLAKKQVEVKDVTKDLVEDDRLEKVLLEERKVEEMQKFVESVTKDMEKLKKIIVKYDKQFREMKDRYPMKYISPLNDKEMRIVQQIVIKYNAKYQIKSFEVLPEFRSSSIDKLVLQPRRPASTLKLKLKDDSTAKSKTPDRPKSPKLTDKRAESAIMMMDYLFD